MDYYVAGLTSDNKPIRTAPQNKETAMIRAQCISEKTGNPAVVMLRVNAEDPARDVPIMSFTPD